MPLIYTFCIQMPFGLITIGVLCLELKYILSSNVHKGITSYRVGIYMAYLHIDIFGRISHATNAENPTIVFCLC